MKISLHTPEVRTLLIQATNSFEAIRIGVVERRADFNFDDPAACNNCVIKYNIEVWVLVTAGPYLVERRYVDLVHVRHILYNGTPCCDLQFTEGVIPNGIYKADGTSAEGDET